MIQVGPPFISWIKNEGISWDHKGKTEIAQIFISFSRTRINFMYFNYVEDGGNKLVLSEKLGSDITSHSMETVTFDYPCEYITRVSGEYKSEFGPHDDFYAGEPHDNYLCSITFHTNKGKYGPYVPGEYSKLGGVIIDFNYQVGGKFCGFFGSYRTDCIEYIGFYVEPLEKLQSLSFVHDFERKDLMRKRDKIFSGIHNLLSYFGLRRAPSEKLSKTTSSVYDKFSTVLTEGNNDKLEDLKNLLIEQNAKIERLAEQVNRLISNKDEKHITRNEVLDFTSKLNEIKDLLIRIIG